MFQLYDSQGPIKAISEETAVTVGVFDGVHRGHQALIRQLSTANCQLSTANCQLSTLIVTLTSHPSFVLGRRQSEYWLDDPEEHLRLLFAAGARYVAVMPFTREVAALSACSMAQLMYDRLGMRALLLGYDSRFGNKEHDDFDRLPDMARQTGFTLATGQPFLVGDSPISSSRIRETLLLGDVAATADLLGRHYSVSGTVQHGRGVGHTLGFPTANIDLAATRKMLPKEGVYAVRIGRHVGMANLGAAPTFAVDNSLLEVHLIDFDGDLYGQTVTVEFLHRLRDIVHFDSAAALQHQLQQDLDNCRQI